MYPELMHDENFELRLSFAQKVYSVITFQLLVTIIVVSILRFVPPAAVANFFNYIPPDYVLCIIVVFAFIPIEYYQHQKHPLRYFFLLILTLSLALFVGSMCTKPSEKTILKAITLTTAVLNSLSLYTFWTTKRCLNFSYFNTFLIENIFVVILLVLIKILYPSGKILTTIYGCFSYITFYGYIVYHTDNLINRFTYTKYISASIFLCLCVNLIFIIVLGIFWKIEQIQAGIV